MGEDQSNRHYVRIDWITEYAYNFISSKAFQKVIMIGGTRCFDRFEGQLLSIITLTGTHQIVL